LFRDGAKAVILYGDERVGALWQGLVERPDGIGNFSTESIFDLARNHRYGERHSGDMLRFYPGAYAHIARKLILFRDETGGALRRLPADFLQEGKRHSAPEYLYEIAWNLMDQIYLAMLPGNREPAPHGVEIDLLKYPDSQTDLDAIYRLLADSGGKWAQLGQALDANKEESAALFDLKGVKDLFAWLLFIPGLGSQLRRLSRKLDRRRVVSSGYRLIGHPHVDRGKVVTALASDRDVLRTEIHCNGVWHELPLDTRSLAILPSANMNGETGVPATLHRVLLSNCSGTPLRRNLTLSLGIVDRPGGA
jgi:hypothetical protein